MSALRRILGQGNAQTAAAKTGTNVPNEQTDFDP